MSKDKETGIITSASLGLKIPKKVQERLQAKMVERNEELILDYLEQIEVHKAEIKRLIQKVNALTNHGYFDEDANL